jgi:hypothetical protein
MRKLLLPLIAAIALIVLPACDGHHQNIIVPPNPSGGNTAGFTNANLLTGRTYVFTVHGVNFRRPANFAVTGNFTSDGAGNITGGVRDTVDDSGRRTLNEAITGTYSVNQDGRGQMILHGNSGQVIYRFVLESSSSGKLFQIGTTSSSVRIDAVGTIELQSGAPATPTGAYIVRLDGEDFVNVYGAVGRIVFAGGSISGAADENDNGFFAPNLTANGSISLSSARGSATLKLSNSNFQHNFVVYFVSPTKIELISTDTDFLLQGNAEVQSSFAATTLAFAAAAPQQVFALAGFDTFGPRVEVGRMTLANTGFLLNAIEDIENDRNPDYFAGVNLSGTSTYSVGSNGRWTAILNNSSGAPSPNLVGWQISPQRSVVLTTDNNIVETGTMRAQTLGLTTASVNGDFAEALSGFEHFFFANLELTANLRFDGLGTMDGTFDSQDDFFGLNVDVATLPGTYSIDPTVGRSIGGKIDDSSAANVLPSGGLPVVYYAVDAKTIYFLPAKPGSIYLGTLLGQTP